MLLIQLQNKAKKKNKYIKTIVEPLYYYYSPESSNIKQKLK